MGFMELKVDERGDVTYRSSTGALFNFGPAPANLAELKVEENWVAGCFEISLWMRVKALSYGSRDDTPRDG